MVAGRVRRATGLLSESLCFPLSEDTSSESCAQSWRYVCLGAILALLPDRGWSQVSFTGEANRNTTSDGISWALSCNESDRLLTDPYKCQDASVWGAPGTVLPKADCHGADHLQSSSSSCGTRGHGWYPR